MAVIKSKNAKKYSIITFILLFFTKFLIVDPKAAHGDIDIGQIIKAISAIKKLKKLGFHLLEETQMQPYLILSMLLD